VLGVRIAFITDRHEPRTVRLVLESGKRSFDLPPVYVCPCGALALGGDGTMQVDDLATTTGAAYFVDLLVGALRSVRPELTTAAEAHLRTVATELHADTVRRLGVHATRWNLPPYALLGRARARPAKCWHVK